jgi:hypothetical protein
LAIANVPFKLRLKNKKELIALLQKESELSF